MIHKTISKKWRKKAVALMLVGTMVGSGLQGIFDTNVAYAAETNTGDAYYDGTYIGKGTGYKGGTTVVKVTVKGDKITDIEEVSNEDTPGYYEKAKAIIPDILEKNSTQVDSVSGATKSCNGIISAVEDALQQAKDKQETGIFSGGKGTKEDPYQIGTAQELLAFANIKTVKSVVIGKNIIKIGKKAFYRNKNLATVKVKGTSVKALGAKAFSQTSKKLTFIFPKGAKKSYKKKFR